METLSLAKSVRLKRKTWQKLRDRAQKQHKPLNTMLAEVLDKLVNTNPEKP